MTLVRVGTWNVWEYGLDLHGVDQRELVHEVIRAMNVDVLAVQEICGRGRGASLLAEIATATGLTSYFTPPAPDDDTDKAGKVAIARASGAPEALFHVGLAWKPGIEAVKPPRTYDGEMWHNLITADLDLGDTILRVGSYHGPPFGPNSREDEAGRVVSAMTRPYGSVPPAVTGADWNSISADLLEDPETGEWVPYHHDPYVDQEWSEAMIYQCTWEDDPKTGLPANWKADRRPGRAMWAGNLRDTAALVGHDWQTTVGHADHADMGHRHIDGHRVNLIAKPAVVDHEIINTETARRASDHLPVVTTLDLSLL